MKTSPDFIDFICEQLKGVGHLRVKKMFGEYIIYVNEKPIIIVCENVAYTKKIEGMEKLFLKADVGYPYKGAKEHYILPLDDIVLTKKILEEVEKRTPLSKKW